MADEDQWLYGDSNDNQTTESYSETVRDEPEEINNQQIDFNNESENAVDMPEETTTTEVAEPESAETAQETSAPDDDDDNDDDDDDDDDVLKVEKDSNNEKIENGTTKEQDDEPSDSDSDDDVHVVIGDIKSTPAAYNSLNIKRGNLGITSTGDNLKKPAGKFSIDDFETIGVINGMPAHEFNLDQLEEKPWRQPGADITDYFNYGFNEDTWRAYCEREKRMRSESGVGLILNAGGGTAGSGGGGVGGGGGGSQGGPRLPPVTINNDTGKYTGIMGAKRAGPPPGRKMGGTIDVIGSSGLASRRNLDKSPPKENVIQVMTADRREYSRKPGFPDMSVPPPVPGIPPTFDMPPPGYPPEPAPFYMPEPDPYYQSYEPTQDSQWGSDPTWQPTNLAIPLTEPEEKDAGPKTIPTMVPPMPIPPLMVPPTRGDSRGIPERDRSERRDINDREIDSVGRERDRERDRSSRDKDSAIRDRDRDSVAKDDEKDRDRNRSQYRHKESRHRHRSRSRSRRHRSRSRSIGRREKKARRERSKEDSE